MLAHRPINRSRHLLLTRNLSHTPRQSRGAGHERSRRAGNGLLHVSAENPERTRGFPTEATAAGTSLSLSDDVKEQSAFPTRKSAAVTRGGPTLRSRGRRAYRRLPKCGSSRKIPNARGHDLGASQQKSSRCVTFPSRAVSTTKS